MRVLSGVRAAVTPFGGGVSPSANRRDRICHLTAAGSILAVFALNTVYLFWGCPFDLASDEAHYWDWSRHLDWSYYSKGPLVAWLIRGSCELFGGLSISLTGSLTPAVRLPAAVCTAVGLAGLYVLTLGVFRRPGLALGVVAGAISLPPFAACGMFMTIDAPLLCCWTWAAALVHRGMTAGSCAAWVGTAVAVGLGVMAKYTMGLLPAAVILCWLAHPEHRRHLRGAGMLALVAGGLFGGLPVLIWNAQNDWVSLRHVFTLTGMADQGGGSEGGIRSLLAFLGGQIALLLGYWFVAIAAGMVAFRPWQNPDVGTRLLWYLTAAPLGMCLVVSLRANAYLNWPAPAYVAGLVLAVAWVAGTLASPTLWHRRLSAAALSAAVLVGLAGSLVVRFPHVVRPMLAQLADPPSEVSRTPVRKYDPTVRLYGWRTLAAEVDRVRDHVQRVEGRSPLVASSSWHACGGLGCYCEGHPEVYCFGRFLGQRHSQYDVWRPNPVADPDHFDGRTVVFVGSLTPEFVALFDRSSPPLHILHHEAGIPVGEWYVTVLHGYRAGAANRVRPSTAY
jgi:4-amino-4-deoxy-L-arabinose transferase-like glycosyltransferase